MGSSDDLAAISAATRRRIARRGPDGRLDAHSPPKQRRQTDNQIERRGHALSQLVEGLSDAVDAFLRRATLNHRHTNAKSNSPASGGRRIRRSPFIPLISGDGFSAPSQAASFSAEGSDGLGLRNTDQLFEWRGAAAGWAAAAANEAAPDWPPRHEIDVLARSAAQLEPFAQEFEQLSAVKVVAQNEAELIRKVEQAARRLGDLWRTDEIDMLGLTVGVIRLQMTARQALWGAGRQSPSAAATASILIVGLPGEPCALGPVLDSGILWRRGWRPCFRYPSDWRSLLSLLRNQHFDVLDLCASSVFGSLRDARALSEAIEAARAESRNRDLKIVVGGRLFHEHHFAANAVGADYSVGSAMEIDRAMRHLIH